MQAPKFNWPALVSKLDNYLFVAVLLIIVALIIDVGIEDHYRRQYKAELARAEGHRDRLLMDSAVNANAWSRVRLVEKVDTVICR